LPRVLRRLAFASSKDAGDPPVLGLGAFHIKEIGICRKPDLNQEALELSDVSGVAALFPGGDDEEHYRRTPAIVGQTLLILGELVRRERLLLEALGGLTHVVWREPFPGAHREYVTSLGLGNRRVALPEDPDLIGGDGASTGTLVNRDLARAVNGKCRLH